MIRGGIKEGGGVFAAPTCPVCLAHMVKRTNRDGDEFWGCSAWPDCDGRPDSGDEQGDGVEPWFDLVDW